jgi:hypothetical protein
MALTDDLIRLIRTPGLDASRQKWEEWYDKIAKMNAEYDRLSQQIGIIRAQAKSELLVPNGAPMPINCSTSPMKAPSSAAHRLEPISSSRAMSPIRSAKQRK